MRSRRRVESAFLVAALVFAGGSLRADDTLPKSERDAIQSLVEKLVAIGLPDSKGGKYFVGPIAVEQRLDPTKDSPVLPMHLCGKQSTVPETKEMDYEFHVDGPHFRLSDGRWLIGLRFALKESKDVKVVTNELQPRELKGARERAEAQFSYPADDKLDEWFEDVPEESRAAMKMGAKLSMPLWQYFDLNPNDPTLGTCYLLRAGVEDAALMTYVTADARCREYWRMRSWSGNAYPFDPTRKYAGMDELMEKWPPAGEPYPAESPSVAFRRDLHRTFFHMLRASDSAYLGDKLAALASATLDPDDPQKIQKQIDAVVTPKKIGKEPPADADLVAKLMAWGTVDAAERGNFRVLNTGNDQRPSIATVFEAPKRAYEPVREDLPKLFALLSDDRPTRWIDGQGARCVGENALRAIAEIMDKNPLDLVNRGGLEPWTPGRRKEANEALVKWWEANGREYLAKPQK